MDFMERIEKAIDSDSEADKEMVINWCDYQIKFFKQLKKDCKKKIREVNKNEKETK